MQFHLISVSACLLTGALAMAADTASKQDPAREGRVDANGQRSAVDDGRAQGPEMASALFRGEQRETTALSQGATALHRGVWELVIDADAALEVQPFETAMRVGFTRPDGTEVTVDGFHERSSQFRARAYCDVAGTWQWHSESRFSELNGKSGRFDVGPSQLPGKLRIHPDDPHQFAYDDGSWFLHIGDTGYRCVTDTEPEWQAYIDQAVRMGATKIRTWFCRSRGTVGALFADDRKSLDLTYWREIDRRLIYALGRYPQIQFQLIPYGEDTGELRRYGKGDAASQAIARVSQARWSAFPNVSWCISNDREMIAPGTELKHQGVPVAVIDRIGQDMHAREPWGTLLTNHQSRGKGYSFCKAAWSSVVTLEDMDQVDGTLIATYRSRCSSPVVNDEDRYEHHRQPMHPRYFFRRLMWASLFSGGHATYGGLRTYEPYDGKLRGVQGYFDACATGKLHRGAHDFRHIHAFFKRAGLTLDGWIPDDALTGGNPAKSKCCAKGGSLLLYLANPTGTQPETDSAAKRSVKCSVRLGPGFYTVRWFDPRNGVFVGNEVVEGPDAVLTSPGPADWVVLLTRGKVGPGKEQTAPIGE